MFTDNFTVWQLTFSVGVNRKFDVIFQNKGVDFSLIRSFIIHNAFHFWGAFTDRRSNHFIDHRFWLLSSKKTRSKETIWQIHGKNMKSYWREVHRIQWRIQAWKNNLQYQKQALRKCYIPYAQHTAHPSLFLFSHICSIRIGYVFAPQQLWIRQVAQSARSSLMLEWTRCGYSLRWSMHAEMSPCLGISSQCCLPRSCTASTCLCNVSKTHY